MSGAGWASLVALAGWLILVLGAFRTHRVGGRTTLAMAMVWLAIFLLVMAVISWMGTAS